MEDNTLLRNELETYQKRYDRLENEKYQLKEEISFIKIKDEDQTYKMSDEKMKLLKWLTSQKDKEETLGLIDKIINSIPSKQLRSIVSDLWNTRNELSTREIELAEMYEQLRLLENEQRFVADRGEITISDLK